MPHLYPSDRSFTDYVHQRLALPIIYQPLGWQVQHTDPQQLQHLDTHEGIDYVFADPQQQTLRIQERFRDSYYQQYNDCTLRYRRDHHPMAERHESEFYKIKADYLVYGITNGSKFADKRHTLTHFVKYVVLDLAVLYQQIAQGQITFDDRLHVSRVVAGKMIAPIKQNRDDSSSFVAFDVPQLYRLFGKVGIVRAQHGFYSH